MQYDFETILDRRGRDALALDVIPYAGVEPKAGFSRIPMWVADMSFPTAPPYSCLEKRTYFQVLMSVHH